MPQIIHERTIVFQFLIEFCPAVSAEVRINITVLFRNCACGCDIQNGIRFDRVCPTACRTFLCANDPVKWYMSSCKSTCLSVVFSIFMWSIIGEILIECRIFIILLCFQFSFLFIQMFRWKIMKHIQWNI